MKAHCRRMHGTDPVIDWNQINVSQTEHLPQVYDVSFPKGMTHFPLPFPGCLVSSWSWNRLQDHFNLQHWGYSIIVLEYHPSPFPKCNRCGSQVPRVGLTAAPTSQRSFVLESKYGSGDGTCNTVLRQVGYLFGLIRRR